MGFVEFIRLHGDEACAVRWGVQTRTVASWRRHERMPRPAQARRIVSETAGMVSMQDIYGVAAACDQKEAA
jgi:hypothetical protein